MEIIRELSEIKGKLKATCLTIGNFDGLHLGHQKLITRVRSRAQAEDYTSMVVTFDPHPLRVLVGSKTPPFITLTRQKADLIAEMGIDYLFLIRFTKELAATEPEDFVRRYLVDGLAMKHLVIGYDYAFGKGRKGDYELLSRLGEQYGYTVERVEPVMVNDAVVSSTRIRDLVQGGHVWEVRPLLGRFYTVYGEVIQGRDRGAKLLGFPTANLKLTDELFPKTGVYAVLVKVDGKTLRAVANIGYNPTFGNDALSVEVHVLDFEGRLYGKTLKVMFVQRIRSEQKFDCVDSLRARIGEDIEIARRILASPEIRF